MLLPVGQAEPLLQGCRHRLPDAGDAQAGAIAVELIGLPICQHMNHLVRKCLGHGHGRVPQAVVEHVLISDFLAPGRRELRQLPDD